MSSSSSSSSSSKEKLIWPTPCFVKKGQIIVDKHSHGGQPILYKAVAYLGKGAFSQCYRMIQKNTNVPYAVKIIPYDKFEKDGSKKEKDFTFRVSNIRSELNTMLQCKSHAGIVQVISFFNDSTYAYVVMDLCLGGTLANYIKTFPGKIVPFPQMKSIIKQVALALQFLHEEKKIVHRDLKGENLFFIDAQQTTIKIADFGFSDTFWNEETKEEVFLTESFGTPTHAAPELLSNSHPIRYKTSVDIWSFGIIIYQMNYGQLPFVGTQTKEILDQLRKKDFQIVFDNTRVNEKINDLLKHMLERDVQQRWNIRQVLDHPIFSIE